MKSTVMLMPKPADHAPARQHGFTLLEMALTLVIASLLSWSAFAAYGAFQDSQDRRQAVDAARQAQSQLRAFALRNGRLPCPDTAVTPTGYENLSGGGCAAGAQIGWFPYGSLGMDIPKDGLLARYAVYRNAHGDLTQDADLAVLKERTEDGAGDSSYQDVTDLIAALNTASTQSVSATRPYITGDAGMAGAINCNTNLSQLTAYWVVVPLNDRSGDGQRLDAPHALNSVCAGGPASPVSVTSDDVVLAESPALLAGWLRQSLP